VIAEFSIQTEDCLTQLHGDLMLLNGVTQAAGALLMVFAALAFSATIGVRTYAASL